MKILITATLILSPAALLALPQSTATDNTESKIEQTKDPHRHFDFWVGSWNVQTQDGKPAGTNTITLECGNKVLQENWKGASGGVGKSLNIYDAKRKMWHQTWVDQFGTLLLLDGNLDDDGNMVMRGTQPGPNGAVVQHQIKWSPQGEQVRQTWTMSKDDGKTWATLADLNYIPVKEDPPQKE